MTEIPPLPSSSFLGDSPFKGYFKILDPDRTHPTRRFPSCWSCRGFQLSSYIGFKPHTYTQRHFFNWLAYVWLLTIHLPPQNKEGNSPQLIHHSHQHEEGVLTDSLLERVWEVAKLLICGLQIKESTYGSQSSTSTMNSCLEEHQNRNCSVLTEIGVQFLGDKGHQSGSN